VAGASVRDRIARQFEPDAGTDWLRVDVYDANGLVGRIDCDRIVSVAPMRGRSSARDQHGPGSCSLVIRGGYWFADAVDPTVAVPLTVGLTIWVYITDAAVGLRGGSTYLRWRRTVTRFVGSITDLGEVEVDPGDPDTQLCPITCTTARARLGNTRAWAWTDGQWPVEVVEGDTDWSLLDRALDVTWTQDPMVGVLTSTAASTPDTSPGKPAIGSPTLTGISTSTPTVTIPILPMSNLVTGIDEYDGKTINDVIADVEGITGGVLFESRRGVFKWATPAGRRSADPPLVIDPTWCRAPLVTRQGIGDVVNRQRVNVLPDGVAVEVEDTASTAALGQLPGADLTTRLKATDLYDPHDPGLTQAYDIAGQVVGNYSQPAWSTPSVTVDLLRVLEAGQDQLFLDLLSLDVGSLVQLPALPRRSPADSGVYWVEGQAEAVSSGAWLLTLSLVPYSLLAPATLWDDLPAGLTWNDVPADLTWIRAYAYAPDPFPRGSWTWQPADLRWRDISTGSTWSTY
jgi:hypothetical protein